MLAAIREASEEGPDGVTELWQEPPEYHHRVALLAWTMAPDGSGKTRAWHREVLGAEERLLLVADQAGEIMGFVHGMTDDGAPPT